MRNRIYTQENIISFIKEALEDFTHIVDSKYITKSEFTKFNKFFKNLLRKSKKKKNPYYYASNPNSEEFEYTYPTFHTYEDAKCEGRYITLDTESVPDLNLKEIYKQFPLLIENHELLISLKPNVKPGRRPKDLEKDYEAERIRKAALEDKATCGICHSYWELVDYHGKQNIIADHGFNIAFGYRSGTCFGARFKSWEKSPESKIQYVKVMLKPTLKEVLNSKPSQATVDALIKMVERYKVDMDNYYKLPSDVRYDTKQPEVPEYLLPGQQMGCRLPNIRDINLSSITIVWDEYRSRLENEIARFEKQINEWVLQPTPKERINNDTITENVRRA
tara:strand:+ start:7593 stop:8594 length:1002 start_codon:yes stop_codon:yes gene_type:complete